MGKKSKFITQLLSFLKEAKKTTFASEDSKPIRISDNCNYYIYEKHDFKYLDRYYGELIDIGQEIVWYKNIPKWGMSYYGGIISNYDLSEICFSFLKRCLKQLPNEFPIRGPRLFVEENFRYVNSWNGFIENFKGEERIFYNNSILYLRKYIGGIIT